MLWLIHTINQSEEREKKRNALSVPANGDINVAEKRLCVNSCGKLKVLWKKLKFYPACLNLLLVNILHGRCSRPLPCVHKKKIFTWAARWLLSKTISFHATEDPQALSLYAFYSHNMAHTHSQNTHPLPSSAHACGWKEKESRGAKEKKRERKREEKP